MRYILCEAIGDGGLATNDWSGIDHARAALIVFFTKANKRSAPRSDWQKLIRPA